MKQSSIEKHFETKLDEADLEIQAFPWEDLDAYCAWLAQQYFLVRHSSRLLALAISKIEDGRIRNEYIQHLHGEHDHDVLLLNDLKSLGRSIGEFRELPSTRLLVHNQYYWLNHGTHDTLLGYAQYLEGVSIFIVPKVVERLEKAGVSALSFLKAHSESDELHYPEGFARMRRNGVDTENVVVPNLEESHLMYTRMFSEIRETLARQAAKSAA